VLKLSCFFFFFPCVLQETAPLRTLFSFVFFFFFLLPLSHKTKKRGGGGKEWADGYDTLRLTILPPSVTRLWLRLVLCDDQTSRKGMKPPLFSLFVFSATGADGLSLLFLFSPSCLPCFCMRERKKKQQHVRSSFCICWFWLWRSEQDAPGARFLSFSSFISPRFSTLLIFVFVCLTYIFFHCGTSIVFFFPALPLPFSV
jgi:hypothetical protein